ncbi:MAG: hypothetical protein QW067_11730 [Thermofilaceae archaeon]
MLSTAGATLFRLGVAVAVTSYLMGALMSAVGLGVPEPLARASGFMGAVSGIAGSASALIGLLATGVGFAGIASLVFPFLTGRSIHLEVGRAQALAAYAALFTVAVDGVLILTGLLLDFLHYLLPFATGLPTAVNAVRAVVVTLIGYYLMVRIFGVPPD